MSEKLRMLVVDDNEGFCQNVADILELRNYEVVTAEDGFKALELMKQKSFDLMLMDIKMPVMNGVETFKKVKEIAPDTPVIMVSAFAVEDLIREALREGAFSALKKPVDFDDLFKIISCATSNKELVLVVDDDENLCANIKDGLKAKGYLVGIANDGDTAIEKARRRNYDVILIDMRLPTINGLETYLSIYDFRPSVAVIIITGFRQDMIDLIHQALKKSAYVCLEKPINMDELVSLLEQIKEQKTRSIP